MKTVPVCTILAETDKGQFFTYAIARSMRKEDVNEKAVARLAKALAKSKKARFVFADFTLERTPVDVAHQATKDYAVNMFRSVCK